MSKANIGWLFYKKMYDKSNDNTHIKNTMNTLLKINAKDSSLGVKNRFTLKTTYPGLLIGSGYAHGISNDFDAKIGFYFDHTTGLPLIQGSSVKGMLRSCFGLPLKGQSETYTEEKHSFIRDLMGKEELDVEALAKEIFEGIDADSNKQKSIYDRDIFYEARVIATNGLLLADDYLAPHGDNPLKNPLPIRFVKVVPEVTFEFSFDLKDSTLASAFEKERLFLELLQTFGVGAKTNVGYGQFVSYSEEELNAIKIKQKKLDVADKQASADSVFEKLKLEFEVEQKADSLHKKIKNDLNSLENDEKEEILKIFVDTVNKEKNTNISDVVIWMNETSKKEVEKSIGKWHHKTLKLF